VGLLSQGAHAAFLHTRAAPHKRVQATAPCLMLTRGAPLRPPVTLFFFTSLSPLNGVLTRVDADPQSFPPLVPNMIIPLALGGWPTVSSNVNRNGSSSPHPASAIPSDRHTIGYMTILQDIDMTMLHLKLILARDTGCVPAASSVRISYGLIWSVNIRCLQRGGHSRAGGNPGSPPDLDRGVRRDDVASLPPCTWQSVQHA
jgi:hypothetical protein